MITFTPVRCFQVEISWCNSVKWLQNQDLDLHFCLDQRMDVVGNKWRDAHCMTDDFQVELTVLDAFDNGDPRKLFNDIV